MYKTLYLKKGKEESLKRFHPWIFSGAVAEIEEGVEEGEIVRVFTSQGDFIAVGMYQIGSIAVRVLSFRDVEIDGEFWFSRLQSAWQMRQAIGLIGRENNNTFRLVHGEGDNLPGLVIDCYGDTAVMQAHSVGMHLVRHEICEALVRASEGEIKNVYYKSETTLPFKADVEHENGFIYGSMGSDVAMENGLNFHIDWLKGQKTGFFVDQRENRHLLETYSKGRSVLNMFCYTGGFSVYAMRGGAKLVHSVDSSAKAIELTNRNIALNFPGDERHAAFCEDAFKFLDANDKTYDLIVLDPPCVRQAPRSPAQRPQRLHTPQRQRITAHKARWHPLHLQLLADSHKGELPQRCLHSCSAGQPQGAHLASNPPACRSPD